VLRALRRAIRSAAPKAKESIGYHMPYYSRYGRLAYFAAFKDHCSFFWVGAQDRKAFAKDLKRCEVVGSTLRIPRGSKAPVGLIRRIVRARVRANEARRKGR
jgi:uncharacterized protein YdhG (YjbR/CyaY superfamily)